MVTDSHGAERPKIITHTSIRTMPEAGLLRSWLAHRLPIEKATTGDALSATARRSAGSIVMSQVAAMDTREPSLPVIRYQGRREMHNLAMAAVSSLEQGGLADTLAELNRRVFERSTDELCDEVVVGPGLRRCSYKPMVELLLLEIVGVMKTKEVTRDEQRTRISWALGMAGF